MYLAELFSYPWTRDLDLSQDNAPRIGQFAAP